VGPAQPTCEIEQLCDNMRGVSLTVQGSLFDHVERRSLGDGAWLDLRSGWLTGGQERSDPGNGCTHDSLFDELVSSIPWRAERRRMYDRTLDVPRLVSFYDLGADQAPHPVIAKLRVRLNDIYAGEMGEPFTSAGLCLYRDGSDSVAWHGDTMVAIVSLGATRVFAMRPRGGGRSLRLPQCHGDLLVMGGSCQRTWEHAVPKTARPTGPRISIQYRPRDVR
jgi:alkylated DNA repair dioxygenase AlkB